MNNATSKSQRAQRAGTPGTLSVTLSIPSASPVPGRAAGQRLLMAIYTLGSSRRLQSSATIH